MLVMAIVVGNVTVASADPKIGEYKYGEIPYDVGQWYDYNAYYDDGQFGGVLGLGGNAFYKSQSIGEPGFEDYKINPQRMNNKKRWIGTANGHFMPGSYHLPLYSHYAYKGVNEITIGEAQEFSDGFIQLVRADLTKAGLRRYETISFVANIYPTDVKNAIEGTACDTTQKNFGGGSWVMHWDNNEMNNRFHSFNPSLPSIKKLAHWEIDDEDYIDESKSYYKCGNLKMNWYDLEKSNTFSDVPKSHWAELSIAKAQQLGLINGLGDGRFGPELPLTQAQALQLLYNFWMKDHPEDAVVVKAGEEWHAPAVTWAKNNSLVTVVEPNKKASREFFVLAMYRLINNKRIDTAYWRPVQKFPDIAFDSELGQAVKILHRGEIIDGFPDGMFHPEKALTRAEASRIFDGLLYSNDQVKSGRYGSQFGHPDYYNIWSDQIAEIKRAPESFKGVLSQEDIDWVLNLTQ